MRVLIFALIIVSLMAFHGCNEPPRSSDVPPITNIVTWKIDVDGFRYTMLSYPAPSGAAFTVVLRSEPIKAERVSGVDKP
jgi:hypothetical protein